jgi:hypothetical protein
MPRVTSRGSGTGPGAGSRNMGGRKAGAERTPKTRPNAKGGSAVATGGRKARTPSAGERSWGASAEAPEEIRPARKKPR